MRKPLVAIMITLIVGVGGCSDKGLKTLRSDSTGPEEFMVMPVKPLTIPGDYEALPAPTPGGSNLTDLDPHADAAGSLGGRAPDAGQGVSASDVALVNHTSRYGVPANTRETLATSDAEFRKRQSVMTRIRLFPVDRYDQAYRKEALDPFDEHRRLRDRGVHTSSAPPG